MKKALSIFLVLVMLLGLCACGEDSAKGTEPGTNPGQTTTEGTEKPTEGATEETQDPTAAPTEEPTVAPTEAPTEAPTACSHNWKDATCTDPKTCSNCGATEGKAAGHSWKDATCTAAKTCSKCGATEGKAAGHNWKDATCTAPKTCSKCNATEGNALGHNFVEGVCTRCCDNEDWLYGIWDMTGFSAGCQFEKIDLQFWGYAALGFTTSEGWYSYQTPYSESDSEKAYTENGNTVTIQFSDGEKTGTMVLKRTGMNELTVTGMTGDLFTSDITSAINSVGKFTKTFFVNGQVSE